MSSIRGTNSSIQDSIFNMTSDELNISLDGPPSNHLTKGYWNNIYIIIPIMFIAIGIVTYKDKINTETLNSLIKWVKYKYSTYNKKNILPMYHSVKAKQSPFIGARITPQMLPNYPRLEGSENLQVRFSIPYRRFQSSDNLAGKDEHRITITTFVEKT